MTRTLLMLAVSFLVAGGSVMACTPTTDGTAAIVDQPTVTGVVDATGCDIGVYYSSVNGTIYHAEIFGARKYGVFNKGMSVTITNSSVHNIGDMPFSGNQYGVGIYYRGGAIGLIDSNVVSFYQKGGIVVDGIGSSAIITNNTVTGLGPVNFIAQNGIQVSRGATGTVSGNTISGNAYTGCSHQDAAKTGCIPYVSAGLLLYDVDANAIDKSHNTYRDDQFNMLLLTSASLHSGI